MDFLIKIGCFVFAFMLMEGVAWFTHKYVMHGFLWVLHKSHHEPTEGFFEWNDLFFVFFGAVGASLIVLGAENMDYRLFLGAGVSAYGLSYIFVHDIFIHRRLSFFEKTEIAYFKALRRAHYAHHRKLGKEDGEAFGMLWASSKFYKKKGN